MEEFMKNYPGKEEQRHTIALLRNFELTGVLKSFPQLMTLASTLIPVKKSYNEALNKTKYALLSIKKKHLIQALMGPGKGLIETYDFEKAYNSKQSSKKKKKN